MRLIQEQIARRKVMANRAQIMQQQTEQKRVIQAELQQAIEQLRR
jgi:hypothetical protein